MPLPGDVSTFTLTFGPYTDAAGYTQLAGTTGKLTPVDANGVPVTVLHTADGSVIVPAQILVTIGSDGTESITGLAHTDDTHLSPSPFLYQMTWDAPPFRSLLKNKLFAVPIASGATVDFDLLANGTTTTGVAINLPSVISVNGHTGAVTLAASDVGADSSGAAAAAQAFAVQRANHTGTQPATTLTGLDTAVAGVVTPGGSATAAAVAADPALKAAYAPLSVKRLARLNRAARPYAINNAVIHPAPPTITESTAQTITTSFQSFKGDDLASLTAISGGTPVLNTTFGFVTNPVNAPSAEDGHVGFILIGDTFELRWRNSYTASSPPPQFEILVDGMPIVAGNLYNTTLATSSPNQYFLKAVFPDSKPREVRIYSRAAQFMEIRTPITQSVTACAKRPWTIGWISDSYGDENSPAGTPSAFQIFPRRVSRALGAEFLKSCQPGSGYTVGGSSAATFADSRRINALAAASPDLIMVVGGTNDWNAGSPNLSALSAAVTSMLTQIAAAMPGVPVIVAGPQPLNYTQTLATAYAQMGQTIRTAALAQPNVLTHIDMIGNAASGTVPAAFVSGTAYSVGQQVTYQGAIYTCTNPIASSAGSPDMNYWSISSWLTGTGVSGTPTGNGNRDSFLYSDGTHPTLTGQDNLVARLTAAILGAIATGATTA